MTKFPAVGHRDMSRPVSLNSIIVSIIRPGICVKSTPNNRYASVRMSKSGLAPFFFRRCLSLRRCFCLRSCGRGLSAGSTRGANATISFSKQHAVIQFRFVEKKNEFGDRNGRVR